MVCACTRRRPDWYGFNGHTMRHVEITTTQRGREALPFWASPHYWGRSLKGNWVVKRKTEQSRFSRARHRIAMWCRANRHLPIKEQHAMLTLKLRGHYAYYGITGNARALSTFR